MSSLAPVRDTTADSWGLGQLGRHRFRWVALVVLALICLAPPVYLAQTGGALATGYTIQKLQAERNAWKVKNSQLELEVAKAQSLAWIEMEAVGRLQMHKPAQQTVVRVDVPPPPPSGPRVIGHRRAQGRDDEADGSGAAADTWLEGVGSLLAGLLTGR